MSEFLAALTDPHLAFVRYALLTGVLASISFGIIGTYVVVRRVTYIAGAISHCVLAGIGAGLYCQEVLGISWFGPTVGAVVVALLSAALLTLVSMFADQREDTVIGALWAGGMATGLLFIAKTPGYTDPLSYLFGNILLLSKTDMYMVIGLNILVLTVIFLFYNRFLALCFDEEYARLRGVQTPWFYLLLLCLTALTIVVLIRIVGIVMVIALLTLPSAIAGNFARGMRQMMVVSVLLCMVFVTAGLGTSFTLDLPTGPVIIMIAAIFYLLILIVLNLFGKNNPSAGS